MGYEEPIACDEFLAAFSEFRDGELSRDDEDLFRKHLTLCSSCRRYEEVIDRGVAILRSTELMDSETPPALFLDPERVETPEAFGASGSGTALAVAGAVAILLGAVAWAPTFSQGGVPEVEVSPVIAAEPSPQGSSGLFPRRAAYPFGRVEVRGDEVYRPLLYEYLPLSTRRGGMTTVTERD